MAIFCDKGLNGDDVCVSPTNFFWWLDEDDNPPTSEHKDANGACWVGMSTRDNFGGLEGHGCDFGCRACPDLPAELFGNHAPTDGMRWLHPHPERPSWDANGFNNPVRADRVTLIPRHPTNFLRAACFDNLRQECFGESVCACFGERSGLKNITSLVDGTGEGCFPSQGPRFYAKGFFTDDFFYQNHGWPARYRRGNMDCRQLVRTTSDEDAWVTLEGGEMFSPAFARMGWRLVGFEDWHCVPNMMIPCVGGVPRNSACLDSFYTSPQPGNPQPDWYNDSGSRSGFATIALAGDPHFRSTDNLFADPGPRDLSHIRAKNEVVKTVFSAAFPTGDGTRRFDQVDHEFRYQVLDWDGMNFWSRQWDSSDLGIPDEELPVVESFPLKARLVNAGVDLPVDLVITRVESRLWLLPEQVRNRTLDTRPLVNHETEYHARYIATAHLAVRYNVVDTLVNLPQSWLPADDPDRVATYVVNYPPVPSEPTFDPPGLDHFVFVDDEGTIFQLPTQVQWMGYLGAVGNETSPRIPIGVIGECLAIQRDVRGMRVPGWPTAHETAQGQPLGEQDMAQIYGGAVTLDFVS